MTRRYVYRGDRATRPDLRGARCEAVTDARGKCLRGRNANMLVRFDGGEVHVVLARQLRKAAP